MESHRKIFCGIIVYGIFLLLLFLFLDKAVVFDKQLFFLIQGLYTPYGETVFNAITYMGSSAFWVFMIIFFWLKGKRKVSVQLVCAFIIDTVSLLALKYFFLRPRPFEMFQLENMMDVNLGPSFPSGHTQRAFSGAFILSHHYKKYSLLFYALAFMVSISRIYLGLHFPLDTLIGAINGIIIGAVSLAIPLKGLGKRLKSRK
ncbi:MAG: phosphatase PAP2 family protein [Candidatus Aenigmatarchaeota archaeon]